MLKFTRADGPEVEIPIDKVVRIRRSIAGEGEPHARSRIDWVYASFVREPPVDVAKAARAEYPKLAQLTVPDKTFVWFKAAEAIGPIGLVPSHKVEGINSSLIIGGKRQFVRETHEEVARVIDEGDGKALPIPQDAHFGTTIDIFASVPGLKGKIENWEEPDAYGDIPSV